MSERFGSHSRRRRLAAAATALVAILALSLTALAQGTTLRYPNFTDTSALTLNGSAQKSNFDLLLTNNSSQGGSAFTTQKVIDPRKDFVTNFRFHIFCGSEGDGMAFVLQPTGPDALGFNGDGMGYGDLDPSVEVEFDIYFNKEFDPTASNHVGLMKNGDPSNHLAYGIPEYGLTCHRTNVRITYDASTHTLTAFTGDGVNKPTDEMFAQKINLQSVLGGPSYAGFTGGTGGVAATQYVLKWRLKSG
jgi:hypothetical protein